MIAVDDRGVGCLAGDEICPQKHSGKRGPDKGKGGRPRKQVQQVQGQQQLLVSTGIRDRSHDYEMLQEDERECQLLQSIIEATIQSPPEYPEDECHPCNPSGLMHLNETDQNRVNEDLSKLRAKLAGLTGGEEAHSFSLVRGTTALGETRLVVVCGVCPGARINTSLDDWQSSRMMFSSFLKHAKSAQGHADRIQRQAMDAGTSVSGVSQQGPQDNISLASDSSDSCTTLLPAGNVSSGTNQLLTWSLKQVAASAWLTATEKQSLSHDAQVLADHFESHALGGFKANGFLVLVDDAKQTVKVRCMVCRTEHATWFGKGTGTRNTFSNFKLKHIQTSTHQAKRDAPVHATAPSRQSCGRPASTSALTIIPAKPLLCTRPQVPDRVETVQPECASDPMMLLQTAYPDKFRAWPRNPSKAECVRCGVTLSLQGRNLVYNAGEHLHSTWCTPRGASVADYFPLASTSLMRLTPLPEKALQPSLVCRGMWQMVVKNDGCNLDASVLLDRNPGAEWYPSQHHHFNVVQEDGLTVRHTGTFFSRACTGVASDIYGQPLHFQTCYKCAAVIHKADFRKRLETAHESGGVQNANKRNNSTLGKAELRQKLKVGKEERDKQRWIVRTHTRSMIRRRSRLDELKESMVRGDVGKMIQDILFIEKEGGWEEQKVLFHFLCDEVGVARRSQEGKDARGNRWHETTRRVLSTIRVQAGPRINALLRANIGAMSQRQTERHCKKTAIVFEVQNISPTNIQRAFDSYLAKLEDLGVPKDTTVIIELSEDETGIIPLIDLLPSHDELVGTCGKKSSNHQCDMGYKIVLGNDENSHKRVLDAFATCCVSTYARVIMINPLHHDLPALAIAAMSACNRFDAQVVRRQWQLCDDACATASGGERFLISGKASDGDSRRFALMLRDMCKPRSIPASNDKIAEGDAYKLDVPGFTHSGEWYKTSFKGGAFGGYRVRHVHSQDPKHNLKKLVCVIKSKRVLRLGNHPACASHLQRVLEVYTHAQHGLQSDDVYKKDRQNVAAAARVSGTKALACLERLQTPHTGADGTVFAPEDTTGTIAMLKMNQRYIRIFFSKKDTLAERIQSASYVIHFLRFWRAHVFTAPDLTIEENFHTRQTYQHVTLSCFSSTLLIRLFRDFAPSLPCCLDESGSDCEERLFANCGGFGKIASWQRNYTFAGMVAMIQKEWQTASYEGGADCIKLAQRGHPKQEVDPRWFEDSARDDADLCDYPSDEVMKACYLAGLDEARTDAELLGMKTTDKALWKEPWLRDAVLTGKMLNTSNKFDDGLDEDEEEPILIAAPPIPMDLEEKGGQIDLVKAKNDGASGIDEDIAQTVLKPLGATNGDERISRNHTGLFFCSLTFWLNDMQIANAITAAGRDGKAGNRVLQRYPMSTGVLVGLIENFRHSIRSQPCTCFKHVMLSEVPVNLVLQITFGDGTHWRDLVVDGKAMVVHICDDMCHDNTIVVQVKDNNDYAGAAYMLCGAVLQSY